MIDIVIKDAVFNLNIIYKGKPLTNNLLIFTFSPLIVVFTRKTHLKF